MASACAGDPLLEFVAEIACANWVDDDRWKIAVIYRQRRRPCRARINLHRRLQQYLITWQPVSCCTTPVWNTVRYTRITWHLCRRTNSGNCSVRVSVSPPQNSHLGRRHCKSSNFTAFYAVDKIRGFALACAQMRVRGDTCPPFSFRQSLSRYPKIVIMGCLKGLFDILRCFRTIPKISIFGYRRANSVREMFCDDWVSPFIAHVQN